MKIDTKILIYIYVAILFVATYLLASRIITSLKTNEFDYFKIIANLGILVYLIFRIIKLSKIENNKIE
ncbi:hypothetical protein [Flavobacterium sp.]|uniref:hypothetical protein n=1 Tax=Flavobacterium sp. TaxID=239 RepID=UPI00375385BE